MSVEYTSAGTARNDNGEESAMKSEKDTTHQGRLPPPLKYADADLFRPMNMSPAPAMETR